MTIRVRYFASVRERLGRSEELMALEAGLTVAAVWQRVGAALTGPVLAAVNQEFVPFSRPLRDGDELAFFPPVTGG